MELVKAERKCAKIRLAIQGPSGSGKTYSALLLAHGLENNWNKIAVIDGEANSSHLYSHLGEYLVLNLTKPFSPERYIEALEACEHAGAEVIIIDGLSQEWSGEGGILDSLQSMTGNSFAAWARLTPRHNKLIQYILQSKCHIIGTLRTKMEYVLQQRDGKMIPEKVGLAAVQRDDLSFEFTCLLDLDIKHNATALKDRTGLFMDKPQFIISETTGAMIKDWCNSGFKVGDIELEIMECQTIEGLRHLFQKYPEYRKRIEPAIYRRKAQIETLAAVVNP